jgi:hypothetical protein
METESVGMRNPSENVQSTSMENFATKTTL